VLSFLKKPENREFVFRYLCSDPRWRVTYEGAVVADLREISTHEASSSPNCFIDIRIRFGPYERSSPPLLVSALKKNAVTFVEPQESIKVSLTLWESELNSEYVGSYILLGGDSIWLEIEEWSTDKKRLATHEAIIDVISELERILKLPRTPDEPGYWQEVLPAGTANPKPQISVTGGFYTSRVIRGFINPGEEGYIRVKVFDVQTNQEIDVIKTELRRTEYVGWSADDSVLFPFEVIYSPGDDRVTDPVRYEVWFYPTAGRLLIEKEDTVFSEN